MHVSRAAGITFACVSGPCQPESMCSYTSVQYICVGSRCAAYGASTGFIGKSCYLHVHDMLLSLVQLCFSAPGQP